MKDNQHTNVSYVLFIKNVSLIKNVKFIVSAREDMYRG